MTPNRLTVTVSLIIINVVVYLVGSIAQTPAFLDIAIPGGQDTPTLQVMGSYSWFSCFMQGELWRLISYQFLHANLTHLLFNMWALYFFGRLLESIMSPRRFLAYYLTCGVAGALFSSILAGMGFYSSVADTPQAIALANQLVVQYTEYTGMVMPWQLVPMIGASAAVYGVMVAIAFMFPHGRIHLLFPPIDLSMRTFALLIIGIAMVTILFNLDNAGGEAGHLGGAIMGLLIMTMWKCRIISHHRRNGL